MFNVTTLDRRTNETFVYAIDAHSDRAAKDYVIAGIEAGTKRGDTVYEVMPVDALAAGPSIRAYGKGGELY